MKPGQSAPSRSRRLLWIAGGFLVVYTIFGFWIAPLIARSQLQQRGSELLGRTVTVQKVRMNPFVMSITIEGLDVRLKDGTGSFLGWSRLYANADPVRSIVKAWKIAEVQLDGFHATGQLHADGTLNFVDIIERLQAKRPDAAPERKMRPIEVDSLTVNGARADFLDQSRAVPFDTKFGPVTFTLTDFRTKGEAGAPYRFDAVTESGEKFFWTGTLSADPVSSSGEFRLEHIVFPKYAAYYAEHLQVDRTEGKLSVQGRYEINLAKDTRSMKLSDGRVQLRDVKVWAKGETEPAVELPALDVTGIHADALARKATVTSVTVNGGHARVRRDRSGEINLLGLLPKIPAASKASAGTAPVPVSATARIPEFLVSEITVKDFETDLVDETAERPARLGMKLTDLSLQNVTLADGAVIPLKLALHGVPEGTVAVAGEVTLKPELKARLQTEVTRLPLLPLSPYVEKFVHVRLTQGAVSSSGELDVAMTQGVPAISFAGSASIEQLGVVDGAHSEELAGFESIALNGVKANTAAPLTLAVDEVKVAKPYARVFVNADKSLNLATLARPEPVLSAPAMEAARRARAAEAAKSVTPAVTPNITIGAVMIDDGEFSFTDRSVEPHVRLGVRQFGGTVAGLSSENLARAKVDLKAAVDGTGPITITGQLDPLGEKKFVDVTLDFKNVDLLPFSPYSGKFAGYQLARGKMALDVKAKLDDKQLDATNVITLNQFTFGSAVNSPDATKLPVRLGVALLKDTQGKIVIDVPMAGRIDDPEMRIGKVVLRVVVNLLTKAAVSPFALLGSMFGGGGDELAYQEFAPGSVELQASETKKLETMVKALTNRPGLSVALEGGFDAPADTYALKRHKLEARIRAQIWEERHATDPNIPPPEKLEITPEARVAKLQQLFAAQFPAGSELGAAPAEAPAAMPPPVTEPEKKSFMRKVVDAVTLKRLRESRREEPADAVASSEEAPQTASDTPAEAAVESGPSLEEMTSRLADTINVSENDLRALADSRAQRVREYFLNAGKIDGDRLFLAQGTAEAKGNQGARVNLSLQ